MKVSIISGFYNRAGVVKESVKSLLNQTFDDYEVIIFDDASSDGTYTELMKLKCDKLTVIRHKENIGFVNGLIHAINSSKGDFIAIHGSGDVSLPERLQTQYEFLVSHPDYCMVDCVYHNINENGKIIKKKLPVNKNITHNYLMSKSNPFNHGGVMYRRNVYFECGGYNKNFMYSQDFELWLRISKKGKTIILDKLLYIRNILLDGVSYNPKKSIEQRKFSMAARIINKNEVVADDVQSIFNLIPTNHPKIQEHIFRMVLVSFKYRRVDAIKEYYKYISLRRNKLLVFFMIKFVKLFEKRLPT